MYRIDTGQARTDLYGIGKGAAQVLDLSPLREGAQAEADRNFAKQQLKSKQEQDREDDIMTNLSAMGKVAIMPKDRELIAGKSKAVRDFVVQNIDGLKKGDAQLMMEYQNLAGDLSTSAEQSKNFREAWEQRGLNIAKEPDAYDEDVMNAHLGRASSEDAGNWNIDDTIYHKNINLLEDITGPTYKYAEEKAKNTPYGKVYTSDEAKSLLYEKSKDGPTFRQIVKNFNKLPENKRLGKTNPVDWYIEQYTPLITIDDKDPYKSSSGSDGSTTKEPKIRTNYAKTNETSGVLNWEYISPPDNPYITTSIGDVRPGIVHDDGENTYMDVTTKPDSDGNFEKKRLGPEETRDFVRLKLGSSLNELREGNAPRHISHTASGISSAEAGHLAAEKTRKGQNKISTEDKQALDWANANPKDKRSSAIKAKLKAKGIQ